MNTKIIKINPNKINFTKINKAAKAIRNGNLVAFPTETVYGLGADVFNEKAISKIFIAKKRPFNDPLIVHIADIKELELLSDQVSPVALKLAEAFWPGPLTLVIKKSPSVSSLVTSGLDTVAVRMPNNNIALSLIRKSNTPIAAPSANLFGRTSPTDAWHVIEDLEGNIEIIIDGGRTRVGVESTVVDTTTVPVQLLRAGGITVEELRTVIGEIKIGEKLQRSFRSPGMMDSHYSPKAKLILVDKKGEIQIEEVFRQAMLYRAKGFRVGIMAKEENKEKYEEFEVKVIGKGSELKKCAANLFSTLRDFDKEKFDVIIAESLEKYGLGLAIMERLKKASVPKSIK